MSPRQPTLRARDIMHILERMGFFELRQRGSHLMFKHPDGCFTLVPRHGGEDIGRGLLRQILREIQVTPEEFFSYR